MLQKPAVDTPYAIMKLNPSLLLCFPSSSFPTKHVSIISIASHHPYPEPSQQTLLVERLRQQDKILSAPIWVRWSHPSYSSKVPHCINSALEFADVVVIDTVNKTVVAAAVGAVGVAANEAVVERRVVADLNRLAVDLPPNLEKALAVEMTKMDASVQAERETAGKAGSPRTKTEPQMRDLNEVH